MMEINNTQNEEEEEEEEEEEIMPQSMAGILGSSKEEDEEDVCRICRNGGDEENPLHYPCACSGSIKYVHQDCLLQWLNHSNARQCEVCKHAFSFSPVYAENAPARLPFKEFLVGMGIKACRGLNFFTRLAFVISVWFVIIPFTTFWIWRLTFARSIMEAQKLFLSRISPTLLLTDCLHGLLLSAGIVFIFLGATSLRDYFRHLRELRGQEADREEDGVDRPGALAGRRLPGQGNRANGGNRNGEVGQGFAGAGQLIRRNAENVAAHLEMQAARLEAHVEQIFDGVDDADGAEDVPFDELVGMQGPVFHLVENAITVLASNAIFLAVVIFLPFTLGRIILSIGSRLVTSNNPLLPTGISSPDLPSALANITLENSLSSVTNLSAGTKAEFLFGTSKEAFSENLTTSITHEDESSTLFASGSYVHLLTLAGGTALELSDVATLAVGYMVVFGLVFCYFGFIALLRYNRGEPLTMGRIYGISSAAEAIPSLVRQFLAGVKYFMTMMKVAFLLVIELGVFPLICGWWLDVCTISLLGTTIGQRVAFFWSSSVTSSLLHWLVGIVYMLQISLFVSLLRGVLRPGVLYFLKDPADPNYNPFRDLIDDPIHKHARRVLLSVVVYGSLIVMLVFLPVKVAMYLAPSMFPLDISVSDPFTEIPADMLLFQICIPFAIEHFKPRATIKKILFHWFSVVGWVLKLTDFLLPNTEVNNGQATRIAYQGRQNGLHDVHHGDAVVMNENRVVVRGVGDTNMLARENENAEPNTENAEGYGGDDHEESEEYTFVIRIVLLLLLAWLSLLSFNSALVVVPVSLGRTLFSSIPRLPITHGVKCNDVYAFNIGCYIMWAVVAGIGYAVDYLRSHNLKILGMQALKWSSIIIKSFLLLSLWIFIIPVLIGLLFELLVVVPLRVPVNESPVFLLYQDWALGLIFLKIWTRLVMLGQMAPLVDESWRIKFDQVRADGFSRLRGLWVLQEIVTPILMKLLTALCVPYVLARGLFPLFGYSLVINSTVYRFAWLGCLILGLLWYCIKRLHWWFTNLHNSIRDDRYLIGRKLHNFGEDNLIPSKTNNNALEVKGEVCDVTNGALDISTHMQLDNISSSVVEDNSKLFNENSGTGTSSRQTEIGGSLRHRHSRTDQSGHLRVI